MNEADNSPGARSSDESSSAIGYLAMAGSALQAPIVELRQQIDALKLASASWAPEQRSHLAALATTGRQIDQVAHDLLHVARAYEGRGASVPGEDIDIATLVDSVFAELRPLADECLVTFQVYVPEAFPAVHSNEAALYAALYHLVLNAIMFNLPGGLVRVEALGEPSSITIHIMDTGTSIPQAEWETIFEAIRPHDSAVTGSHSRGLGLPIARRELAQVGGSVEVAQSGRAGTVLRIRIPTQFKDAETRLAEMQNDLESKHRQSLAYAYDLRQVYRRFRTLNSELENANQRLEETNRIKSNFLAIVSHELRSPFATLEMAIQLFARYGLEALLPEQRELYEQIAGGTHQARHMVDHLLKAADLLSRESELRPEPVDVAMLVQESAVAAMSLAEGRGLCLNVDSPHRLVVPAVDRQLVTDALWQLIDNALKFTPAPGDVLIRLSQVEGRVVIEVADTGPGIPLAQQGTLWAAFSQLIDPIQRGTEGFGLGLALVRLVALKHGGNVHLQSEPGKGSVFGFWLPLSGAGSDYALT
jgi:signal transduction histidine kinase